MAISFKMHGSTARCDEHLCGTCRNAAVLQSARGQEYHKCQEFDMSITEKIVKCTMYRDQREPSLHDFYEMAWTIKTDKTGRAIGFERPGKDDDYPRAPVGF